MNLTNIDGLSTGNAKLLHRTEQIVSSYLHGLGFVVKDAGRDPDYIYNHLLSVLAQDILQSAISITTLASEGMLNVAKRELRFLLESSIKICYVQQSSSKSTIDQKVTEFDKIFSSSKITVKKDIALSLLPVSQIDPFLEELGRLFGLTSNYVHLTPKQIQDSISNARAGVTAGFETVDEINNLNCIAERIMAASLVLIFHSVPEWVAGDWLVESDGSTVNWYFLGSRFISGMDSQFDYKHERQSQLNAIQQERENRIRF